MKLLLCLAVVAFLGYSSVDAACKGQGEKCFKVPWARCCGGICRFDSNPFKGGRCVSCLTESDRCSSDGECCRGKCKWLTSKVARVCQN